MLAFWATLATPQGPVGPLGSGGGEGVVEGDHCDPEIGLEASPLVIDAANPDHSCGVALGVDDAVVVLEVGNLDVVRHVLIIS